MILIVLISILFIGGIIAWLAEGWNKDWPRWVTLITLGVAGIALIPLFGMPVEAQRRQPIKKPLPDRVPERPVPGETVFTAIDQSLNVKSFNGFNTSATAGYFSHDRHSHDGKRMAHNMLRNRTSRCLPFRPLSCCVAVASIRVL